MPGTPEKDGEGETPRCPSCRQALDDIQGMTEAEVLQHIQTQMLKELLRSLRNGTATHQEMAIARGLLRDNKVVAPKDDVGGDEPEETGPTRSGPPRARAAEVYDFMKDAGSATEGG